MLNPAPPSPGTFSLLEQLASRRCLLLCLLLALNALVRPYAGLIHDARLYAAQVSEAVAPGTLSDDLYLRYGSQDRYTVFTPLLAPLVRLLGLQAAYFLAYLASKALLLWALLRLVLALVEDRAVAVVSLLFLAVAPLPFGGNAIFHVNETFLTPRPAASALALLALERALAGRWLQTVPLLAGSLLLHPVMAFAGALVLAVWWLAERLPARWLVVLAGGAAVLGGVVVGYEPLGTKVFGYMDPEWHGITLQVCFFIRPACWAAADWVRIACAALVVGVAAGTFARRRGRLLAALLVAGVLGLAGSLVAVHANYHLLIQTSPYRTLWLLELLALPLGFWGAARLWQTGTGVARCAALALVLLLTADGYADPVPPVLVFAALLPVAAVFCRGLSRSPRRPEWLAGSARISFVTTVALLCVYDLWVLGVLLNAPRDFHLDVHPIRALTSAGWALLKLPLLLLGVWAAVRLVRADRAASWRLAGLLGFWLTYQGLLLWVSGAPWYAERFSTRWPHGEFVAAYLRQQANERAGALTVYWTADLEDIWFRAKAKSYYHWGQLTGCAFNRGTAAEGKRRALQVRAFEASYLRWAWPPLPWWSAAFRRFYEVPLDTSPTEEDLLRLCAAEGLDYVVLEHRFEGLYSASDGFVYIYDVRRLRPLRFDRATRVSHD
jgi:hypothetical protein